MVDKRLASIALPREEPLLRLWADQHSQLFSPQPLQLKVIRDFTLPEGMEEMTSSSGLRLFRRRSSLISMARLSLMIWASDPWRNPRGEKGAREPHLHLLLLLWKPSPEMASKYTLSLRERTRRDKQQEQGWEALEDHQTRDVTGPPPLTRPQQRQLSL